MAKDSLADLVAQLGVHSKNEEHDHVLQCSQKILKLNPEDNAARHSQLVALIKLDMYNKAFDVFSKNPALKKEFLAEFAYACYKLEKSRDLEELVASNDSNIEVLHALAQTYYRQDRSSEAAKVYTKIGELDPDSPYKFDMEVNVGSIKSNQLLSKPTSSGVDLEEFGTSSYDQLFNLGTAYLAKGSYEQALHYLQEARLSCESCDLPAEELSAEVASILIQAAYVKQLLGEYPEAKSILENVKSGGTNDELLDKIIANNLLSLSDILSDNPHKLLLELKQTDSGRESNLQKSIFGHNVILLKSLAGLEPKKSAKKLSARNSSMLGAELLANIPSTVLRREEEVSEIQGLLKGISKKLQESPLNIPLHLLLTQMYSLAERYEAATSVMENLLNALIKEGKEQAYSQGLVGILNSLYKIRQTENKGFEILYQAAEKWTALADDTAYYAVSLLTESSDQRHIDRAAEYFRVLADKVEDASIMTAGSIAAGTSVNNGSVSLINIATLTKDIDVQSILQQGIQPLTSRKAAAELYQAVGAESKAGDAASTKKRKAKAKLPKEYDAEKQPDPERWLPKRDRSTWRPKKKDKKNAKTTQGGSVDNTTEMVTQTQSVAKVTKSKPTSNKNKKKKKGK